MKIWLVALLVALGFGVSTLPILSAQEGEEDEYSYEPSDEGEEYTEEEPMMEEEPAVKEEKKEEKKTPSKKDDKKDGKKKDKKKK